MLTINFNLRTYNRYTQNLLTRYGTTKSYTLCYMQKIKKIVSNRLTKRFTIKKNPNLLMIKYIMTQNIPKFCCLPNYYRAKTVTQLIFIMHSYRKVLTQYRAIKYSVIVLLFIMKFVIFVSIILSISLVSSTFFYH